MVVSGKGNCGTGLRYRKGNSVFTARGLVILIVLIYAGITKHFNVPKKSKS